jgi:hypothetical protein
MSNLVSTRRLWNNLHIVRLKSKYQRFHLHLAKTHNGDLVYLLGGEGYGDKITIV